MCVIGEGALLTADGSMQPARDALAAAGLSPVTLRAKEGLALINGTDGMLGMLVLGLADLRRLAKVADIAASATIEGLMGTDRVFAADLQRLRPQLGQADSARNLRTILDASAIVASHREHDTRVQDAYSLRCSAAVHGAVRDAIEHAERIAERELASAVDNPMILPDGRVESCGNFHGAPLAQVADYLTIAIADLSALSEQRTDRMLDATRSHGLPPFLSSDPGVNSGLMIAQYTQAAMVAENRRLATPASVDTIATSAMQEDHVSMGWGATRKLRQAVTNLNRILAIELTCAARAVELRAPLTAAAGTAAAVRTIREVVPGIGDDRWLAPELALVSDLVEKGHIVDAVEAAVGALT
jgi:histidine ammonia-lyase